MANILADSLARLMDGHTAAVLKCYYTGEIVRRLTVDGDELIIDAITETVRAPLDTEITYKPWLMDRGDLLFDLDGRKCKICGEADFICYGDPESKNAEWHSVVPGA